ncbi:MAG: hypothetical protein JJE51_14085 [Thermoanaerobaculia bacterium]|nr:hypothetical protein [Thermoanaerobaculia bacterium]
MHNGWSRILFGFAIVTVLVAALFAPALIRDEVFTFRDHADYFQPLRYYTSLYLKVYDLPYWNPYSASGEPWVANPQTGVFYPPTWLFIPLPFESAYMLYLALHLAILGCGSYLLFARTASDGSALIGAVAITFCGPVLSLLDVSNNLATFAWVPLVIWSALERRARLGAWFLALAFLGGEPFFAALAALLFVIASRNVRDIVVAGLGAAGLSAIQLLPFLEMVRGSDRAAGFDRAQIVRDSMRPLDWLRVAIPPKLTEAGFDPALSQHFVPVVYMGIVVVILAIAGVAVSLRTRATLAWVALLIGAVIVGGGGHIPFGAELLAQLPLTPFRYPARLVPFGALAIAALAVAGWDRFRPAKRWLDLVLVLVVLADVVPRALPLLRTVPFEPGRSAYTPAIGRAAKILRIESGAMTDREAWIGGYTNLYQRRFDAWTAGPVARNDYMARLTSAIANRDLAALSSMSVGYILSDRPLPRPLEEVARLRSVTAYSNPFARPMAEMRGGTVELFSVDARQARVVVNGEHDGVLIITQQDAPSWRVFVDGMEREKRVVEGVFRGVDVPRGRHEVIWRYIPRTIFIGACMTIITALSLQLGAFVKHHTQRKFSS